MSPAERVDETSRSLGRIEQQLETLTERGEARDAKLETVTDRQHKAANAIQGISAQVTGAQKSVDDVKTDMVDVKSRLSALEAPVKRAMAQRKQRRALWAKIVSVGVLISGAVWLIAQPILKALADFIVATYWPHGNGS